MFIFSKADFDTTVTKWRFVRNLPVRGSRSERRCFSNRPLVVRAANATEEPRFTDAAAYTNDRSNVYGAELHGVYPFIVALVEMPHCVLGNAVIVQIRDIPSMPK